MGRLRAVDGFGCVFTHLSPYGESRESFFFSWTRVVPPIFRHRGRYRAFPKDDAGLVRALDSMLLSIVGDSSMGVMSARIARPAVLGPNGCFEQRSAHRSGLNGGYHRKTSCVPVSELAASPFRNRPRFGTSCVPVSELASPFRNSRFVNPSPFRNRFGTSCGPVVRPPLCPSAAPLCAQLRPRCAPLADKQFRAARSHSSRLTIEGVPASFIVVPPAAQRTDNGSTERPWAWPSC